MIRKKSHKKLQKHILELEKNKKENKKELDNLDEFRRQINKP